MDPVGLASSVLAFIDFATKLVRGTYEIHSSISGTTQENVHLTTVTNDLKASTIHLSTIPDAKNDPELIAISKECQELSTQLLDELGTLQKKHGNVWKSFAVACAILRKQKNVLSMETRLNAYRQQVQMRLMILLFAGQSPMKAMLHEVHQNGISVSNASARRMEDLENRLSTTLQSGFRHTEESNSNVADELKQLVSTNSATTDHIQGLCERLDRTNEVLQDHRREQANSTEAIVCQLRDLKLLVESLPRENRILKRLQFASILHREHNINSPASDTFSWVLSEPHSGDGTTHATSTSSIGTPSFHEESESELCAEELRQIASSRLQNFLANHDSTFFLYGKAGCGKSTFIKFLAHHSSVTEALQRWAGSRTLVVVTMFFWRSDDPLQKSLEGFYRTMLYHTLGQAPELIPKVFPGWEATGAPETVGFQIMELEEAFSRLIQLTRINTTHRFCYFIDGLDEYEGDSSAHKHLAEQLAAWARSDTVKIVCSARPHTIFVNTFGGSGGSVDLGRLNRQDITNFAYSAFKTKLCHPEYAAGREGCQRLVKDIVRNAEGVFLWAVLVVRSLINGVLEGDDDESSLCARVHDFPTNLNDMFRHMLSRIGQEPYIRKKSDILLYLVTNNKIRQPFTALLCSWLEDLGWCQNMASCDFPFDRKVEPYTAPELERRLARAPKLLHFLTQGLLEVQQNTSSPNFVDHCRIEFVHRSVRDFLREEYRSKGLFLSNDDEIQAYLRLYVAEF